MIEIKFLGNLCKKLKQYAVNNIQENQEIFK